MSVANEHILVPVDFSEHSRRALVWACNSARDSGASITILHVVNDPARSPGYYRKAMQESTLLEIEEAARKMFDQFLAETGTKLPGDELTSCEIKLVSGVPVGRILELAAELKTTHIVMGSQGWTNIGSVLLGSKAEQVVRQAKLPVTVVKGPRET